MHLVCSCVQMPVQKVIVIHHSKEYVDDVTELKDYVVDELNVLELEVTSDEVRARHCPEAGSQQLRGGGSVGSNLM